MGAKIETYLDCRYSQFSWEESMLAQAIHLPGQTQRRQNTANLTVNEHPGISKSQTWFLHHSSPPSQFWYTLSPLSPPSGWIQVSSPPQRVATYLKANYPRDRFEKTFLLYWTYMFYRHIDLSKPENMTALLREEKYSDVEIETIMKGAQTPEGKKALADRTKEALDRGAFGAPWFWVTNAQGKAEPFFGSDRFHYMWQFLGIPFQDVEIIAKGPKL
ncbi:conserved hypothetical protein [Histoplasma capsulatum G186AR]|uniref:DSBA-like thioredoxin domain-containing protein n=1 Tax=Ajellomyces capsulatus (strain G186AR / H82 / ATCC MYA-2454 / RMSCC 2432) TaxID=447093 RepID=C0NG43_AJECG|nr:uncharacterized protein HCBG_01859 [Histoplasma capsulatum G186AR]EEH10214.1 conserved hypothetical protein [Histoplasma capsulatum G186AR]